MSIYDEYRENVRKKLYDASVSLFKSRGYDKTSVTEITSAVGVAKGTFYNFFASKQDLLFAWAWEVFSGLDIQTAMDPRRTAEQNLHVLVDIIASAVDASQGLFKTFLSELLKQQGGMEQPAGFDFISLYRGVLASSLDGGKLLAREPDLKLEMINSVLFMGMLDWIGTHAKSHGLDAHLKKSVSLLIRGLSSD